MSNNPPEYSVWANMKGRCLNSNNKDFRYYGGRGITICERWINSFENFLFDMGHRPSIIYTLERKNNNGNYEPSNCTWDTRKAQSINRRPYTIKKKSNVTSKFRGVSKQGSAWLVFFQHKFVGRCKDEIDAATLYNIEAFMSRGDAAIINVPQIIT